jgi:hypothetical protein
VSSIGGARGSQALNDLLKNYDKRMRPDNKVDIEISAWMIRHYHYCEKDSTFMINVYFRQRWFDNRIAASNVASLRSDVITGGAEIADEIWVPDTFQSNDASGKLNKFTRDNIFCRIYGNGTVFMSGLYTIKATCTPDVSEFPRDVHDCEVNLESYGFDKSRVDYKYIDKETPIGYDKNNTLSDWTLLNFEHKLATETLSSGTYARLTWAFKYQRNGKAYVLRDLVPSLLATLLVFMPMFMAKAGGNSRVMVSAILLIGHMVLITPQLVGKSSPRPGATTAIDCYILTNLIFSAVSFVLVAFVTMKHDKARSQNENEKVAVVTAASEAASRINRIGRMAIVALYVAYNVVYWCTFTL